MKGYEDFRQELKVIDLVNMVSQDLSSPVVCWWVPLHINGMVCGLHHSRDRWSRRCCRETEEAIIKLQVAAIIDLKI